MVLLLFNIIGLFLLEIVELVVHTPFLVPLYWLGIIVPSLAVAVRRLHDIGKNGLWLLIALIPFIGAIVLLVFYVTDSQPGDNQYGPNPKMPMATTS